MRVAVTRPGEEEGGRLSGLLRDAGAVPLVFPLLRLVGPPDPEAFVREVEEFMRAGGSRRWILFTSRNALPPFLDALAAAGRSVGDLAKGGDGAIRVAAVGSATARALSEAGLRVDLIPERFTGDDLLDAIVEAEGLEGAAAPDSAAGLEVLLPRAERARETLPSGLAERGARVRVPVAYRTLPDPGAARRLVEAARAGAVDVVALTSGSAAEALATALTAGGQEDPGFAWPGPVRIAVLGPVTEGAARARGLRVDLVAPEATLPAFARAIAQMGR